MRTVIVDDATAFRTLLVEFLADEQAFDVVGIAADGVAAEKLIDLTDPDVVILDVHLPRESGLEVLERMREEHAHTMFVLTSSDDTIALDAERLGADLCIDKLMPFDEMCTAIRDGLAAR